MTLLLVSLGTDRVNLLAWRTHSPGRCRTEPRLDQLVGGIRRASRGARNRSRPEERRHSASIDTQPPNLCVCSLGGGLALGALTRRRRRVSGASETSVMLCAAPALRRRRLR